MNVPSKSQKSFAAFVSLASSISIVLALVLAAPGASNAQPAGALGAWTLQWADEFSGSGAVSGTNWLYDLGHCYPGCPAGNWGTGEIENMTNSTANVNQTGGHLAITPIRDGNGNWTSGRIETQRTDFQPPAGGAMAFEASIQQPNVSGAAAQGYWPAFWSLGAPFRGVYTNWPSVGEIDILEDINGQSNVFGTLHCGTSPGGPCNETSGIGSGAHACPGCQTGYHTYRIEYDKSISPQQIRWYLDGSNYFTVNSNQVDSTTWNNATNHGFFMILNVAIGGGWPGNPTGSTASGVPMNVDYVRVYYANGAGGATATRTNTPGGPTPTRTNTPTGPTPTKTNTPPPGTDHGVDNVSANQARPWYKCAITCSYVIVHYIVPGQVQQNVQMTYNSGLARWEYLITGITSGQVLQYQFTYNDGVQHDTAWFNWTKP
jgi:beta-glucanase (GH16 family)